MLNSVYLLTKKNLQVSVLEKNLRDDFVIFTLPPSMIESNIDALAGHVVLMDIGTLEQEDFLKILNNISDHVDSVIVAIINADRHQSMQVVYDYQVIKGVFFEDDSLETLVRGIRRMAEGEYWLSRKVMSNLLEHHRSQGFDRVIYQNSCNSKISELTPRELEILKLVSTGVSNGLIADTVCLSKNTVKTHLTNLYRKLDINNRTQATLWVKSNLPALSGEVE